VQFNRGEPLVSRTDLQRERESWYRERVQLESQLRRLKEERKQLRKHLQGIEFACRQALSHVGKRAPLNQNADQLRQYLKQIERACQKALFQVRLSP
jgi:predicted  nucleic acid-binding Zn-ribbon protein